MPRRWGIGARQLLPALPCGYPHPRKHQVAPALLRQPPGVLCIPFPHLRPSPLLSPAPHLRPDLSCGRGEVHTPSPLTSSPLTPPLSCCGIVPAEPTCWKGSPLISPLHCPARCSACSRLSSMLPGVVSVPAPSWKASLPLAWRHLACPDARPPAFLGSSLPTSSRMAEFPRIWTRVFIYLTLDSEQPLGAGRSSSLLSGQLSPAHLGC